LPHDILRAVVSATIGERHASACRYKNEVPAGSRRNTSRPKGMEGIRRWLKANAAPTRHQQTMLLWANSYVPDLLTAEEKATTTSSATPAPPWPYWR
jgi:hypothetical protein